MKTTTSVHDAPRTASVAQPKYRDDESRLDAAIAESFPASDPVAIAQPGSLLAERNAARGGAARFPALATATTLAIVIVAAIRVVASVRRLAPRRS